jgi:hypothetical protein
LLVPAAALRASKKFWGPARGFETPSLEPEVVDPPDPSCASKVFKKALCTLGGTSRKRVSRELRRDSRLALVLTVVCVDDDLRCGSEGA